MFIVVVWPFLFLLFGRVNCCWLALCIVISLCVLLFVGRVNCCWLAVFIFVVLLYVLLLVGCVYCCCLVVCKAVGWPVYFISSDYYF